MTDFALVGGDPAPGQPGWFTFVSRSFRSVQETAEVCASDLRNLTEQWGAADWSGEAADRFRALIGDLPKDLDKLFISYLTAEKATAQYADRLAELQADARTSLGRARSATDDEDRARARHQDAANRFGAADGSYHGWQSEVRRVRVQLGAAVEPSQRSTAEAQLRHAERERGRAGSARSAAQSTMATEERSIEDARSRIRAQVHACRSVADARQAALATLRSKLAAASEVGIQNRNFFERGRDFAVGVVTGDPEAVAALRDGLRTISQVLSIASTALMFVAPFLGPAGPVLLAVVKAAAVVTSIAALLCTVYLTAGGHPGGGGGELLQDAVVVAFASFPAGVKTNSLHTVITGPGSVRAKATRYVLSGGSSPIAGPASIVKRALHPTNARHAKGALRHAFALPKGHMIAALVQETSEIADNVHEVQRLRDAWTTSGVSGVVREAVPGFDGSYLRVPGRPPVRVDAPDLVRGISNSMQ
ncbi:MAG: hypothetical protein ABL966_00180 [Acidimicrobiales bacterium]